MRIFAAVGIMALVGCSPNTTSEATVPVRVVIKTYRAAPARAPTTFATLNEAAVKALEVAYHFSPYYELGGAIVKIGDRYAIGAPHTDFSGDSVQIDMDPISYAGEVVANYHTHPCNSVTHVPAVFSPADLHEDRSYGKPGFMADFCTGIVTVFDPLTDRPPALSRIEGWQGRTVGKIAVTGTVLDQNEEDL